VPLDVVPLQLSNAFTRRIERCGQVLYERCDVNLSYAKPNANRYVSVSGMTRLRTDRAKMEELWSLALRAWSPNGLDDEDLALLKVDVEQAEYWDPESSTLVQITGFVKALATGERYDGGENEKLQM
jgi:general stress protein 26